MSPRATPTRPARRGAADVSCGLRPRPAASLMRRARLRYTTGRSMRATSAAVLSVFLLACSGTARHVEPPPERPTAPEPEPEPAPEPEETALVVPEDTEAPEGPACTRTSECGAGLACRGAPGCTTAWACGAPRETCGPEIVAYCTCDGVTFHARRGEILGFSGLVGSGRTELMKVIFGVDRALAGAMRFEGRSYLPQKPADAINRGHLYALAIKK